MYILNRKTGLLQQCGNEDVIKVCRKDPEHYQVSEEKPAAAGTAEKASETTEKAAGDQQTGNKAEGKPLSERKSEELKALAKEKGIEGAGSLTKDELLAVLKDVV